MWPMKRFSFGVALVFSVLIMASMGVSADEPEYENPELQVKFNFKGEGDMLSPQTKLPSEAETTKSVQADVEYDVPLGGKIGRNPVNVGTWTSDPVELIYLFLLILLMYGGKILKIVMETIPVNGLFQSNTMVQV